MCPQGERDQRDDQTPPRSWCGSGRGGGTVGSEHLGGVTLDIRNQRQLACPLDRRGELPLVPRAHARQPARQDFSALREEATEGPVVLVIEHARAGLAHRTGLGWASHASSSSISSISSGATAAATSPGLCCSRAAWTPRWRSTLSSSFTARSYSGNSSPADSNWATT